MNQSPRNPSESAAPPKRDNLVVGIGASAGGLAALKVFFSRVPADTSITFVVVVHLAPDHESHLADLLQPHVAFPVEQIAKTTPLEPNRVYIIPPNANLSAVDTHLRLSKLEEERRERAPIDHFFRTLATTHDGNAVGVILTGTGSDGSLGIKDIKTKGGVIFVQDPDEAEYDGMPRSAIATGLADRILPVSEIPDAILRLAQTAPQVPVPSDDEAEADLPDQRFLHKVFAQLRSRTDRDFSRYKRSTILRRIARRMQLNYIEDPPTYLNKLQTNPEEAQALADDFLITVTNFFRDAEVFEKLQRDVIPKLFDGKGPSDTVRVWSVGCATGEEAYSLAILLVEEAGRRPMPPQIQVFASDLHKQSLEKAREGYYTGDLAIDLGAERLKRFFQKQNGGYRIHKEIRDLVVFAPHNLLGDPPFSRLDLIACRNLLIYLRREVQSEVIELFHYALYPEGFLVLGSAETIDGSDLFRPEDKRLCIFRKRNIPTREPRLPVFPLTQARLSRFITAKGDSPEPISHAALHLSTLEQHAPPSLLVSPDNKIAHLSNQVGRYLLASDGEPTSNVFKLVRSELQVELMTAIQTVREKKESFESNPIPVRFNGHPTPVVLRVVPAAGAEHDGYVLVLFQEREPQLPIVEQTTSAGTGADPARVHELQLNLAATHQRLRTLVEEYESSQEEMKASNEELQSANEELRSTMEELETSKEELQSINEELQTVNQENRHKVEELAQLSGDLQNLLAATDIATLFLDHDLRILRFTPKVSDLFNMRIADRGRPLSDLTHRLGYTELESDAKTVLSQHVPIEREIEDTAGLCYLTRVMPYRIHEDHFEGVVITFIDITRRKEAEKDLRESEERYRLLVASAKEYAILMLDITGHIVTWNAGAERLFGYTPKEIVGNDLSILFTEEDRAAGLPQEVLKTATEKGNFSIEGWRVRKDGSRFWGRGVTERLLLPGGALRGFSKILRDNTERKVAEDELAERGRDLRIVNEALSRANEDLTQFAFAASHDLREPLRTMTTYAQLLARASTTGDISETDRVTRLIVQASKRMNQLLNDLLTYTELNYNNDRELSTVDLNLALAKALQNLHSKIEQSSVEVTCDDLPIVLGNEPWFVQLFQNLIANAINYCGEQAPQVRISVERNGDLWHIAVADNGIGIDPQFHEQIFGAFKRLHGNMIPGTGMGLAISKRIVERCGGRIWVKSQKDQGSTFYFTLAATAETRHSQAG